MGINGEQATRLSTRRCRVSKIGHGLFFSNLRFIVKTGGDAVFSMKVQTAWRIWTTLMRTKNLRLKQALEASEAQILFLF